MLPTQLSRLSPSVLFSCPLDRLTSLPTRMNRLGRSAATLIVALALCSFAAEGARADEPPLPDVSVEPWDSLLGAFFAPTAIPGNTVQLVVRSAAGDPVANANVTVEVGPEVDLCHDVVLTTTTDSEGVAHFTALGGGCKSHTSLVTIIRVNGVVVRNYSDVKSPDFDGTTSNLRVDLGDLLSFSDEFGGKASGGCHDYDNNGNTGLADFILFVPAFRTAAECN